MTPSITVIVPTVGRETLERCLESVVPQLSRDDKLIVIYDGEPEYNAPADYANKALFLTRSPRAGRFGHPVRNHVLDHHVQTTHVWSLDDDDIAEPGALVAMRRHVNDPWTIFRMRFGTNHWAKGVTLPYPMRHKLTCGNIGTPMIFAPVGKARFGHHYSGDFDYATSLQQEFGNPVYADDTVAVIRP